MWCRERDRSGNVVMVHELKGKAWIGNQCLEQGNGRESRCAPTQPNSTASPRPVRRAFGPATIQGRSTYTSSGDPWVIRASAASNAAFCSE
jgi:hypothetical protein